MILYKGTNTRQFENIKKALEERGVEFEIEEKNSAPTNTFALIPVLKEDDGTELSYVQAAKKYVSGK